MLMDREDMAKRQEELKEAALPLLNYLNKHYNPHCCAVVTEGRVEILSGEETVPLPMRD